MTDSGVSWSIAIYVGVGLGAFLAGLGIFVLCSRAGGLIARLHRTLDVVDQQMTTLSVPIATTLTHVGGIADTADSTISRLGALVGQLENVVAGATKTAGVVGMAASAFGAARAKARAAERPEAEASL